MSPLISQLRERVWGICVHWTTQTTPRRGNPLAYPDAVDRFDVEQFADTLAKTGAGYLVFTPTHAWHWPPAPIAASEKILPGRSCGRDLIGEIANAVRARGMLFLLYYNHSCNNEDDPDWQKAAGWQEADKSGFEWKIQSVLREMGMRYGERVSGYWIDSAFTIYPHNPDWAEWTDALKTGYSERVICYNSGINNLHAYTPLQDYWAGEFDTLGFPLAQPALNAGNGLPFHSLFWLDDYWLHHEMDKPIALPIYSDRRLLAYVRDVRDAGAFTTLNLGIYQDGTFSPETLDQVRLISQDLKNG